MRPLWNWNRPEGFGPVPTFGRTVVSAGGWALHCCGIYFRWRPYMKPRVIFNWTYEQRRREIERILGIR